MLDVGLLYPLWNHGEPDSLLERIIGEVGIDHVTIPAVTGPVEQFRLFHDREAPYFRTEGGWHFPPQTRLYAASGLRPIPARWTERKDWLTPVVEIAKRAGVRVVFRINLCDVLAVAQQLPAPQLTAWNQQPAFPRACISHASVREMVRATLEDLGRFEPAGFELEGMCTDTQTYARGVHSDWLAGSTICFCPSCRAAAEAGGVDVDAAARSIRASTEAAVRRHPGTGAVGVEDALVQQYCDVRAEEIGGWIHRLPALEPNRSLALCGHAPHGNPASLTYRCGTWFPPLRILRVHGDGIPDRMLLRYVKQFGEPPGVRFFLAWTTGAAPPAALVRQATEYAQAGVTHFSFEGVEEGREDAVTSLKQAVRYARRG